MASTRPRSASVASRPAVRLLKCCGELCDLGAVDPGHLWMQQRGRLVGGDEFGLQCLTPSGVRIHLVAHFRRRDAVHHHLDQLLAPDLDALNLARGCREAGAVFHPKPVHLASELGAELLEQLLVQQLVLESLEDSGFYLVAPDSETVTAGALLTSAEARETVATGHDEAGAAHAALRQSREEVLRSPREADVPARVTVRRVTLWRSFAAFQSSSLTTRRDGISFVIHSTFGLSREIRLPVSGFLT